MVKTQMGIGIVGLLSNYNTKSIFSGKKFFFEGDFCQKAAAQAVADSFGIRTYLEGGIPFVGSKEEFERIKIYLIENKINGWWHYVIN